MKYYFTIMTIVLCTIGARAQAPYTLTIPPDARATGMGDAGIATSPDAVSQHWNVAKYAFSENNGGVSFSYTPWMTNLTDGLNLFYLSGYGIIGSQAFSASLRYFSMGEITSRNDNISITSKPADWAFDLGYSRHFGEQFSIGIAFRYVSTNYMERDNAFSMTTAGAFAVDLGAYYRIPFHENELTFGAALSNVGSKLDMGAYSLSLPMNIGVGTHYKWAIDENIQLRFSLDVNKPFVSHDNIDDEISNSLNRVYFGGGAEYSFMQSFFVRAGYKYNKSDISDNSHFTVGVGLYLYNINFDVSYLAATGNTSNALNNTLRFTVGYTFAKKSKK